MYRYTTPRLLQRLSPWLTWSRNNAPKATVYLTFDDGPHPEITPWVMNELERHNARGTFFCVGDNVRKYPETYRQVLERGHRTGNHTFNHLSGWDNPNQRYLANIAQCRLLVDSDLFRPPYGKISPVQAWQLRHDYRLIMWSILSRDFEKDLDTDESLAAMMANTQSGSIVLFHDSLKAEKNLKTLLPAYLQFLADAGFQTALL